MAQYTGRQGRVPRRMNRFPASGRRKRATDELAAFNFREILQMAASRSLFFNSLLRAALSQMLHPCGGDVDEDPVPLDAVTGKVFVQDAFETVEPRAAVAAGHGAS